MNIQPINIWKNGENKIASVITLISIYDDLKTNVQFHYELREADYIVDETTYHGQVLGDGNLSMNPEEYAIWDSSSDINLAAYQWATTKLNLVLA